MKVLVVSQHYWPESFRINEVAESLQRAGCSVTVLTGQPNYPDGKVFQGYRACSIGTEEHAGCTIHRVPLVPRGKGTAMRLIANYLSFLLTASVLGPWSLRGQRFDVIFVYGTSPILQAIAGVVLKHLKQVPLVTWVQDLWPQSLEATGFVRNRRILKAVAVVVRWIYRRSDLLLVQSDAFIGPVKAMAGEKPVVCHPNPGELAFSEPLGLEGKALILDAGFNVVFAGNMGTVQALDTVLNAAERLLSQPLIRFVLIGSGSRSEWLAAEVEHRRLTNVRLAGRFPGSVMPSILSQASALLVSLIRSPIMAHTVPSKIQAYLAAGRPIVAALDGEGARVVAAAGAGVTCPAEDPAALAAAIADLSAMDAKARRRMGNAGRRYYEEHFDPPMLAKRLVNHFSDAINLRSL